MRLLLLALVLATRLLMLCPAPLVLLCALASLFLLPFLPLLFLLLCLCLRFLLCLLCKLNGNRSATQSFMRLLQARLCLGSCNVRNFRTLLRLLRCGVGHPVPNLSGLPLHLRRLSGFLRSLRPLHSGDRFCLCGLEAAHYRPDLALRELLPPHGFLHGRLPRAAQAACPPRGPRAAPVTFGALLRRFRKAWRDLGATVGLGPVAPRLSPGCIRRLATCGS
mmetsp:Transcript_107036/g.299619  ORF Transcript_107036/g.299619 Transcript_107036/m.299619 type:complete len:221 (-) Transcript_107036:133-795(-)